MTTHYENIDSNNNAVGASKPNQRLRGDNKMTRKVKWGRSEEGYVESKCGRFDIVPLYMGRCSAQAYNLIDYGPNRNEYKTHMSDTQRDCKENAQDIIDREAKT